MSDQPTQPTDPPLTRAQRSRLAHDRRVAAIWREWNAKTEAEQDFERLRSLAREKASFAIAEALERAGVLDIAPGELATIAQDAIEAVMKRGTVNGKQSI